MGDTNTEKWKTVKLPKGLSERVDEFVKSQEAYHQGWTSNSQVVAHAIRQFLESKGSLKTPEHEPIH
jgi:metal-responsive CopG/Arc/MetJ family transcriptional regulator|tara:strand:+ start:160 stop:360 length:201 start_codon:yes stop_codon:yes gene_type:complete